MIDKGFEYNLEKAVGFILYQQLQHIMRLLSYRDTYRKARQFAKADEIRDILRDYYNIQIKDTNSGIEVELIPIYEQLKNKL